MKSFKLCARIYGIKNMKPDSKRISQISSNEELGLFFWITLDLQSKCVQFHLKIKDQAMFKKVKNFRFVIKGSSSIYGTAQESSFYSDSFFIDGLLTVKQCQSPSIPEVSMLSTDLILSEVDNHCLREYRESLEQSGVVLPEKLVKPTANVKEFFARQWKLFGLKKYSDFTFIVGDKSFNVHKNILANASEVFDKQFTSEFNDSRKNKCTIIDIEPHIFEHLLLYIYCNELPKLFKEVASKLFKAAHYYDIKSLCKFCVQELVNNLSMVNAMEAFEFATIYENDELKMEAWKIIKRDILEINDPLKNEPLPLETVQRIVKEKKCLFSV